MENTPMIEAKNLMKYFDTPRGKLHAVDDVSLTLMPGKTILIPTDSAPSSGPYYKIMKHTFVTGDTVYDLCNSYGLDYTSNVMFLQRLNNRDNMATFYVGQSIYMPVYMAG